MKKLKNYWGIVIVIAMLISTINPNTIILAEPDSINEPETGQHGSGSYQLNEVAEDSRFYTEYYVGAESGKKDSTADIKRRTTINVYAKAGEVILFGSSVSDSEINAKNEWTKSVKKGTDIVITTPDGTKISNDVIAPGEKDSSGKIRKNGYGYIANHTQEKYGPMVNHNDENDANHKYYVPLTYEVKKSGVYTFEFHSKTGYNDGTSPTAVKAGAAWKQNNATVAAWDVTVLGNNVDDPTIWEVKSGRAWADYLALTTGDGNAVSDLDVHILTHDGYVYKVDFKKAAPFGFIFFANNTGFMTTSSGKVGDTTVETHIPIYHSFYDSTNDLENMKSNESVIVHKPYEADTATEETYKIFFNQPNDDLNGIEYKDSKDGKKTVIKTKPDDKITIENLKFKGIDENIAHFGHGGVFSFNSSGEAMIAITLDLRKAIFESEKTIGEYNGSGMVEIVAPAHKGENTFYWDGKDTDGLVVPSGIYGNQNVYIATEIKRGEIHFPVIDMEGLTGGLQIKRLNHANDETASQLASTAYNLYYNNNPLAYGTIEGKNYTNVTKNGYNILTDGTKSFNIATDKGGIKFFDKDHTNTITTLVKDDKEYLSIKLFNTSYTDLSSEQKAIIDAEFGKEVDTFHFEPVNSSKNSMTFKHSGYYGGGNQAGIDAWTYYSQEVKANKISFAVLDSNNTGIVRGQIFYDSNRDSAYESPKTNPSSKDYPLANMRVCLMDKNGKPLVHKMSMPCFDDSGYFIYDDDGSIKHEEREVYFDTMTDANGNYRFTGVPMSEGGDTDYYVHVMLTEQQTELMRYTCTTSKDVKSKLKSIYDPTDYFLKYDIGDDYGADGNKLVKVDDDSKLYGYKYQRTQKDNETVYDLNNADNTQKVTLNISCPKENGIPVADFKKIGYCTAVPEENQKDYKITKKWGINSQGSETHKISDGLTVELWVWNEGHLSEEAEVPLSRRTGTLLDTQVLNEKNNWTYTWKNLDNRLQYYVLEYYTKKKDNGDIIYNDKHEPRLVLIGGTMPIFDEDEVVPTDKKIYGFNTDLGDYPGEKIEYPEGSGNYRIPIQKFEKTTLDLAKVHSNSITKREKLESIDNNARQYDVKYQLVEEDGGNTNAIYLTNSQVYDDRTYYVWLDHETVLPDLIAQTFVEHENGHQKKSHSITLEKDKLIDSQNDEWSIKGLSISSLDAASVDNFEGNATSAFRIKKNGKNALFTATNHGNYKTGTGTRTYQVKYVVTNNSEKNPVSIVANKSGELVLASNNYTKVENNPEYVVYSWFMTIHVYDVKPDAVIKYDPKDGNINLQKALPVGTKLNWKLIHDDKSNENSIVYKSDDSRKEGILQNDILRVPLYKAADDPNMGTCADLVGIAYAGDSTVDDISQLKFSDTYESRYSMRVNKGTSEDDSKSKDGTANVEGQGGTLSVELNTSRNTHINRIQDHANYADINFIPKKNEDASSQTTDVFYYKVVVMAEDSAHIYKPYDDIDATEGVVMYTYFTMQSTAVDEDDPGDDEPDTEEPSETEPDTEEPTETEKPDTEDNEHPHTNDPNNWLIWLTISASGAVLLIARRKRRHKE